MTFRADSETFGQSRSPPRVDSTSKPLAGRSERSPFPPGGRGEDPTARRMPRKLEYTSLLALQEAAVVIPRKPHRDI